MTSDRMRAIVFLSVTGLPFGPTNENPAPAFLRLMPGSASLT